MFLLLCFWVCDGSFSFNSLLHESGHSRHLMVSHSFQVSRFVWRMVVEPIAYPRLA
ncbi:hypothetical protein SynBIOSE41_01529 [Synechococcus sp. BIOS-E4-1]|nr:hypothetical protein SynBIOSE41_01529 [Synechococcus sp. BIOS-E4-1]